MHRLCSIGLLQLTVNDVCLHSCIHSLSKGNRAVLQYLNCWGRLAMCLALSQPQDDLHSHLSRQHGSLWRGGGGWRERRVERRVVMFPFCPLAAFLCVPASETDTPSHTGRGGGGGDLSRWTRQRDSRKEIIIIIKKKQRVNRKLN